LQTLARQGDQIERMFSDWAIVYFGQFSGHLQNLPKFLGTFFHGKMYALTMTKNRSGYIFGDFF
jgi:hypothetical protein